MASRRCLVSASVSLCTSASIGRDTGTPAPKQPPERDHSGPADENRAVCEWPARQSCASRSQVKFRPQKNRLAAAFCPSAKAGSGYATFFSSVADRRDLLKREPKALRMGSRPSLRPTSLSKP